MSNFEKRVQLNKIIESQLPEFLVADFPKAVDFFKQYYISQEKQGGNIDLVDNLDRYIKVDNLVPEVVVGKTTLSADVSATDTTITVASTKGFPDDYGLLKIADEIITYTGKTATTFTGCIRGFNGITGYDTGLSNLINTVNKQTVVFSETSAEAHNANSEITNLSALFLQEFYRKLKKTFTPGLEEYDFVSDLDVGNFIKNARNLYQSKGIEESIKILFKVLYGVEATVIDLESRLLKPSAANYIRRETIVAQKISGDPFKLEGQTIFKSTDEGTNASVSDVEIFTRNNESFYRLGLFVGYNDRDLIEGTFTVPGSSRVLESVSVGSSIINVDSTIGFGQTGTLVAGENVIDYTSKSINQFYGCTNVGSGITASTRIRSNEFVYGYEGGDITKRVDLRLTGVLADFKPLEQLALMEEGEKIEVRNVGEVITNPPADKTYKQIFSNSWIYNTSSTYDVDTINGSNFKLKSDIDKSSLKQGDTVDILNGSNVVGAGASVLSVSEPTKEVILGNIVGFAASIGLDYSIRRRLEKSESVGVALSLGNDVYIADTLNVYTDEKDEFGYVTSNSLPSYKIYDNIIEKNADSLGERDTVFNNYKVVVFPSNVDFIDGDEVLYTANNPIAGLVSGATYFVRKFVDSSGTTIGNKIYLYASKALLQGNEYTRLDYTSTGGGGAGSLIGIHTFTLRRHEDRVLSPNQILRKFSLNTSLSDVVSEKRNFGSVGVLIDGVEISSPESRDKIYFGPINEFEVLNGGKDYDVINPPSIAISKPIGVGNTTALVEPIVSGVVRDVLIDPQDFDIESIEGITLVGANGSGCQLEPVIGTRFRELSFDSRALLLGGGVDIDNETITFTEPHNLFNGQHLIYNQNGHNAISIGSAGDPSQSIEGTLVSGDEYVTKFVNTTSIKLFKNDADAAAGINTIGFSTATNASGIHKFRTLSRKNIREIKVLQSGSGYTHRKLRVKPSGISTEYNTFSFKNHGFETGEIVDYSNEGSAVGGLDILNRYSIVKIDSDNFSLIDVGVGGTIKTDLIRSKIVDINSVGVGTQIFQYPPISIDVNVSYGSSIGGTFVVTPIITGEIIGAYLHEQGTGYGSNTLNLHKKPLVSLTQGKDAQLSPIILNGRIDAVQVRNRGQGYKSSPVITTEGSGTGAVLRPVLGGINGEQIVDVKVINGGIGFDPNTTSIFVSPRGSGAKFDLRVRDLTVNDAERFGEYTKQRQEKIYSNLSTNETDDLLVYSMYGYSSELAIKFEDDANNHSPIIGWAYDGNPIYGPYGYSTRDDIQSGVRLLKSGYTKNINAIENRPLTADYPEGFFIEDYQFTDSGDLDKHNGRFCKTKEFPNGVYAYFVGVSTSGNSLEPSYPYFVGNSYRSKVIQENFTLNQKFDFNNSDLIRNTFPYKVNQKDANYDFINESYEFFPQVAEILSVTQGSVNDISVINGGTGYQIGDVVNFDESDTEGRGLRALVSELKGIQIDSVSTTLETYENVTFEWDTDRQVSVYNNNGYIDFNNNDTVLVSGLSTSVTYLADSHHIGFTTETVGLANTMNAFSGATPGVGVFEDIFVSNVPVVSAGNTITIFSSLGTEIVRVLNNFDNGVLRIQRFGEAPNGTTGVAHSFGSELNVLSDRVKLPVRTKKFSSQRDDFVYFKPSEAVGVGLTDGSAVSKIITVGVTTSEISVPTRTLYLPNHPFANGQKVTLSKGAGTPGSFTVGMNNANANTFFIPDVNTKESELYVINKGRNYIGLVTESVGAVGVGTTSEGLFFYNVGNTGDRADYLIKSEKTKLTGDLSRITTLVSCAETHGLSRNDVIKLNVRPNTIVGVGTTSALRLALNLDEKKILVNPTSIDSSDIDVNKNTFTLVSHGFKTGDKIYYTGNATGLDSGDYFVIRDSLNKFRLAETKYESNPATEKEINITNAGSGTHIISLINPKIDVIKNSDIQFNLQDPSLFGYNLKIYRENNFINEFVSVSDDNTFNVVSSGSTIGLGTLSDAALTIKYSNNIPTRLYYTLENAGYISTSDTNVNQYSEINYIDSEYNGSHRVFGVTGAGTTTTFKICPNKLPSVLTYTKSQCDNLEYSTKSASALSGSIGKVKIISEGFNFERMPKFVDVTSEGINANIKPISSLIGQPKKVRFKDIGYDYPSDKTLRPQAFVPPVINLDNLDTIKDFDIVSQGSRYLRDPNVILINDTTKEIVDKESLLAKAPNGAIAEIQILAPLFGLESEPHKLVFVDNSNGVGISTMTGDGISGIATCTLVTPVLGFVQPQFNVGDEIFVEGIELESQGTGYNSADYQYRFFKVKSYNNISPATLEFEIVDDAGVGLSTNVGLAKTVQSGYATLINKKYYPEVKVIQERAKFFTNEQLYVDTTGAGYSSEDISVSLIRDDYIKVMGSYDLNVGDKIKGVISGTVADVTGVTRNRGLFNVDYSSKQELGWRDDTGKTSVDHQVIPNNDYYQNLSYSVKSPVTWEQQSSPVNSIIHPAGLKNFADVGITSTGSSTVALAGTTTSIAILDVVNERRVDIINNFDNVVDYDIRKNALSNFDQSKFLKLQNRKLDDYIECRTNRVLVHDDISGKFSSRGFKDTFIELDVIDFSDSYVGYVIQVVDPDTKDVQLSELVYQSTTVDSFLFEKYTNFTDQKLGDFSTNIDSIGRKTLIFTPTDPFDRDHDIKILKRSYLFTALAGGGTNVGTSSFGSIDLVGSFVSGIGSVGTASSIKTLVDFPVNDFNGMYAKVEISDRFTSDRNYIEAIVDFDGTDTYLSEYYFDSQSLSYSSSQTGILSAIYDSNAGIVSLTAQNVGVSSVVGLFDVRSTVVGFGTTTAGIGTYRYLVNNQPAGTEKSVRIESTVGFGTTAVRVGTFDLQTVSSSNSVVRVSAGETSAIHQVSILSNTLQTTVIPGPFAAVNNVSGLGTFGGEIDGSRYYLNFYPDTPYDVEVQGYNEVFYAEQDYDNTPIPNTYGPVQGEVLYDAYDGINGLRANRTQFDLTHEGDPIYVKGFDPTDTAQINYTTGIITLRNHFFNTGEELIYTPKSTFVGIGSTAVGIGTTESYTGVVTDRLPDRVYPIALTPDTFQLSTRKEYANAGIFVTFTDAGLGNIHELEITKKLSKTVIALDGIVQQPVAFTPINHTLEFNNGGINAGISTFNLSGISSVQPRDILKIDDEYMKIIEVGLSTNVNGALLGPINGIIAAGTAATLPTVSVQRGTLGTRRENHSDGAEARIFRGSINIVENSVHFVDPPKGNTRARRNESNLPYVKAEFSGRTFLRSNYEKNMLFDDVSDSFTGVGKTYTLTTSGLNTTGVGIGSGILFINGVFQTPSTINNSGNNYDFEQDSVAGISSVVFTGITSVDGSYIQSESDINQNQLPRGGLIVSLGSTPGLGYAPLVGAEFIAETNSSGAITGVVGVNTFINPVAVTTALYNNISGILEIETSDSHYLKGSDRVRLVGLEFTCSNAYSGVTTTIFPDHNRSLDIVNIIDATKLNVQVGPSTIVHNYLKDGQIYQHFDLNVGSGYRDPVGIAITDLAFVHKFVRAISDSVSSKRAIDIDVLAPDNNNYDVTGNDRNGNVSGNNQTITVAVGDTLTFNLNYGAGQHPFHIRDNPGGSDVSTPAAINNGAVGGSTVRWIPNTPGTYYYQCDSHPSMLGTIVVTAAATHTPSKANYTSRTGVLRLTINNHGLAANDTIRIADDGLIFTCDEDQHFTEQPYPRSSDPASGQDLTIVSVTTNIVIVNVGSGGGAGTGAAIEAVVGVGGTLKLNVTSAGTGYKNPRIIIPEPVYENMEVIGVSRLGVGATTETGRNVLMNLTISQTTEKALGDRFFDAANLIESNVLLIADIAYGRMLAQFPSYTPPAGTNGQDCKDDIVDVLESVSYNLKYGGNDYTVDAANLYITGAHVSGEEQETAYAFDQAKALATQVMRNEAVTIGGYSSRVQVFDTSITYDTVKYTPTNVAYTSSSGITTITVPNHGFSNGDQIKIRTNSLIFKCSKDNFATEHRYPRPTDPAAGTFLTISNVTTNTFRVNVGASPVDEQYNHVFVTSELASIERKLTSTTTPAQCANVASAIHVLVGIVTTAVISSTIPNRTVAPGAQYSVDTFKLVRNGYDYRPGDVFKVVGLVTAKDFAQPTSEFQVEVTQTFNDFFSAWSFGELDYIDSVAGFQDGFRKRFPIFYIGELLSFELDSQSPLSSAINLDAVLVIFVNGVLQTPGKAYTFDGGSSFIFTEPPQVQDKVDIFFYIGQDNVDITRVEVKETIKKGDDLAVNRHPLFSSAVNNLYKQQVRGRTVSDILGSDLIETDIYTGPGINDVDFRPFDWSKQKVDKFIKGDLIPKSRDILEARIFPTAKIIGDVTPTSSQIFVDNIQFFNYEEEIYTHPTFSNLFDSLDAVIFDASEPVGASFTSSVSVGGTISGINTTNSGSGYSGTTLDVKFSAPKVVGVGIGTTATATATITNGSISSVNITNPGLGYTSTNPPHMIIETPTIVKETITGATNIQGFSGIITGISETAGTGGHPLALKINFRALKDYTVDGEAQLASDALDLVAGYPIMVYGTKVGSGVTSVFDSNNAVVATGTTFLDNVYVVSQKSFENGPDAELILNVHSDSPIAGISTSGGFDDTQAGTATTALGYLSWGRIYNYAERSGGVSIGVTGLTVDAGLSTFPVLQRRGNSGFDKSGAIRSVKGIVNSGNIVADNQLPIYGA